VVFGDLGGATKHDLGSRLDLFGADPQLLSATFGPAVGLDEVQGGVGDQAGVLLKKN